MRNLNLKPKMSARPPAVLGRISRLPLLDFLYGLIGYTFLRIRQLSIFSVAAVEVQFQIFGIVKRSTVSRMFWGRGSLYRTSFHILITIFTSLVLAVGLLGRVMVSQAAQTPLALSYGAVTNNDLLQQGASLSTVFALDEAQPNYGVTKYTVAEGDTLSSIAEKFSVSKDTVRWANDKLVSAFSDNVKVGWELLIPEIDGVLYEVKAGDDLAKVVQLTSGNRFDIIELNGLIPPHYTLIEKQRIFVPNGKIAPPPAPIPQPTIARSPGSGGYIGPNGVGAPLGDFPAGAFDSPLTNPQCQGYTFSRGYSAWHDGLDLAKGGGCPIRAIAAGTVIYAGWKAWGSGYTIIIDHGGGVQSQYLHGDGNIWVRPGDYVLKGQDIMYMGSTGNSTGIHLHLTLKFNGYTIDPAPYVPF